MKDPRDSSAAEAKDAEYQPPAVESVLDADELGREVLYAGFQVASPA